MRAVVLDKLSNLKFPKGRLPFDASPIYRKIIHLLTLKLYRPTYIGMEHVPAEGAAIIICNHVSYMDGPIIDAGCARRVRYLIDQDIYDLPVVHYLMSFNRSIPISYNRKAVEKAFDEISEGLRAGDVICIFPEGSLTFTGSLGRFRPGIEFILKRDPVPVIPMAISGLWGSSLSRKYRKAHFRWWPRMWGRRVTVVCGPAIPAEQVSVNYLQDVVLKLKYSIGEGKPLP